MRTRPSNKKPVGEIAGEVAEMLDPRLLNLEETLKALKADLRYLISLNKPKPVTDIWPPEDAR